MREISVDNCFNLLKHQPIFSLWPDDLLMQFVEQLEIVYFSSQEVIVTEGDIIDKVYFIISGKAEVFKHEAKDPTKQLILATLHAEDSIGLSDTGLYSSTGIRTATVVALTIIILIKIDVELLHRFLTQHPHLNISLASATEQILKMRLIKQAAPFSVLTIEDITKLANQIEVMDCPRNTVIFKQGDKGDYCYIVQDGQIEISRQESSNSSEVLAVLSSPAVFGETAILMDFPRSATARTINDVRLLRLLREDLLTILAKEKKSKQAFATMILERSRPKYLPDISAHQQINDEGELMVILKNPHNHEYYQLTQEGWLIWQLINGIKTVKDITMELVMAYNIFSPSMVNNLMFDLAQSGFIEVQGFRFIQIENLPTWMIMMDKIKKVMEYEWPFPHIDQWITKVYRNQIKVFYTLPIQMAMLITALVGFIAFALFTHKALHFLPQAPHIILLLILVDIAGLISIPLHELAHAFTTKHFDREVSHFGVGWYWVGPMAFTDTSDMWLSSKWPRIMVNLAGVAIDFVLAGLSAIIALIMPWHIIALFCWMFSIFIYLGIYHNLYPLIELDGYYVLMDLFDRPHLREDAVAWLVDVFPKIFKEPVFSKTYKYEILYWLICLIFIILSPLMAWFVQHFILAAIFPGLQYGYWRWFLPIIAITLSLVSVWVEIQKQRLI